MKGIALLCLSVIIAQNVMADSRIIKSTTPSRPMTWPFLVDARIGGEGQFKEFYGFGSLIGERVVVTARYITEIPGRATELAVSKGNTYANVTMFLNYPSLADPESAENWVHADDIGLVFLEKPVKGAGTVELNGDPDCPAVGDVCSTVYRQIKHVDVTYLEMDVFIRPMANCRRHYADVHNDNLCASHPTNLGHIFNVLPAGAPLVCTCGNRKVLAGIASPAALKFGNSDPFTRISSFKAWIDLHSN